MIKAVIFDIGGVVIKFSNAEYYRYLSGESGVGNRRVRDIIEDRELPLLECGKIGIDKFNKYVASALKISMDKVRWFEYFKETMEIDADVLELVGILHEDYITAYMTNIDASRYKYTVRILDRDKFDYRFTSFGIGIRKPSAGIYTNALKRMRVKPEETVFIDNQEDNIDGARKLGINAIHFVGRRALDEELAKLGL